MPSPTFATLALGILASVPVTLLIWAITAAVWARFGRPRLDLTTAIFEHPDPATEADRLRTTGNMLAVATGVAVVTFVALGLAAHAGERADAWPEALRLEPGPAAGSRGRVVAARLADDHARLLECFAHGGQRLGRGADVGGAAAHGDLEALLLMRR